LDFCVPREVPELYIKTVEHLGLYACIQCKNGFDVMKFLKSEILVKTEVSDLPENHTGHKNSMWEYHLGELLKT